MSAILRTSWSTLTRWRQRASKRVLDSSEPVALPEQSLALQWGLRPPDLLALRRLLSQPEWGSYLALLARVYERHSTKLKSGLDFADYRQECGALAAIEEMANIADQVVLKMEELHDHAERNVAQRAARDAASVRVLADSHWSQPTGS